MALGHSTTGGTSKTYKFCDLKGTAGALVAPSHSCCWYAVDHTTWFQAALDAHLLMCGKSKIWVNINALVSQGV